MLGFSVYLGQPLNKSYILNMVDLGYDIIFTSLQIPEENYQTKLTYLVELCQLLKDKSVTYII
ncbi:MupG family TIM beta-alpha barrel fold protein, partial [Staphylococcus haemolyticus]|uniref:MupG family TIM beta-alpha barrel fold protein n=1 Tax=Staphylococcus haemolyticus TaxID=1283 RepID=UPI002598A3C1